MGSKVAAGELAQLFDFGKIATGRNIAAKDVRGKLNALARLSGRNQEFTGEQETDKATALNLDLAKKLAGRQKADLARTQGDLEGSQRSVGEERDIYARSMMDKLGAQLGNRVKTIKKPVYNPNISKQENQRQEAAYNQKMAEQESLMKHFGIQNQNDLRDQDKMLAAYERIYNPNEADRGMAEQWTYGASQEDMFNAARDAETYKQRRDQLKMQENEMNNRAARTRALDRILGR
jgi:hypothetical protein